MNRDCAGASWKDRSCKNKDGVTIWSQDEDSICKQVESTKIASNTTIQILHDSEGRNTLKAEGLRLYFSEKTETPQLLRGCKLGKEIISTINGIQIAISNCSTKKLEQSIKERIKTSKPSPEASRSYRYIAYYMDYLEQKLVALIKQEVQQTNHLECLEKKRQIQALQAAAKANPTAVIRAMTKQEVNAVYEGGFIVQLQCKKVKATLMKQLDLPAGMVATSPIAEFKDKANKTITIQWRNEFWWNKELTFKRKSTANISSVATYKVNGHEWITFTNGKLQEKNEKIHTLTSEREEITLKYSPSRFTEASRREGIVQQNEMTEGTWQMISEMIESGQDPIATEYIASAENMESWAEEYHKKESTLGGWIISSIWFIIRNAATAMLPLIIIGWWIIKKKKKKAQTVFTTSQQRKQLTTETRIIMEKHLPPQKYSKRGEEIREEHSESEAKNQEKNSGTPAQLKRADSVISITRQPMQFILQTNNKKRSKAACVPLNKQHSVMMTSC